MAWVDGRWCVGDGVGVHATDHMWLHACMHCLNCLNDCGQLVLAHLHTCTAHLHSTLAHLPVLCCLDNMSDQSVESAPTLSDDQFCQQYMASADMQQDYWMTRRAVSIDVGMLKHSKRQDCRKTVMYAISLSWKAFEFADYRLRNDARVLAACSSGLALQFASMWLRQKVDTVLPIVKACPAAFQYSLEPARTNEAVMWAAIADLANVHHFLQNGRRNWEPCVDLPRGMATHIVSRDGLMLRFAKTWRYPDEGVVVAAVKQNFQAIQYACISHSSVSWTDDLALDIVRSDGLLLRFLSNNCRLDKQVVLEAVQQNGLALGDAPDRLRGDKQVVLAAVKQNGLAMQYAAAILTDDPEIALAAVQNNYLALQHVHPTMQDDQEVVDAAMQFSALALEFANPRFQMDVRRAKQACEADSLALRFAQCVSDDDQVVKSCVARNGASFQFASSRLRSSADMLELALLTCKQAATYATWRGWLGLVCRSALACIKQCVGKNQDQPSQPGYTAINQHVQHAQHAQHTPHAQRVQHAQHAQHAHHAQHAQHAHHADQTRSKHINKHNNKHNNKHKQNHHSRKSTSRHK